MPVEVVQSKVFGTLVIVDNFMKWGRDFMRWFSFWKVRRKRRKIWKICWLREIFQQGEIFYERKNEKFYIRQTECF